MGGNKCDEKDVLELVAGEMLRGLGKGGGVKGCYIRSEGSAIQSKRR